MTLLWLWRCEGPGCHEARFLSVDTRRGRLCAKCWKELRKPTAAPVPPEVRRNRLAALEARR